MYSRKYQCIFVHIPKTGGSSIENLIWKGKRQPQDLYMGLVDRMHNKYQTGGLQHLFATHIQQELGSLEFNRCFKFALVRNPWDRLVSQYVYMQKRKDLRAYIGMEKTDDFKSYLALIEKKVHVQWEPQYKFLLDANGQCLLNHVACFEEFTGSVQQILKQIGIKAKTIPHEKKGERKDYRTYYDEESRQWVAELYKRDIELLGYSYEPKQPADSSFAQLGCATWHKPEAGLLDRIRHWVWRQLP